MRKLVVAIVVYFMCNGCAWLGFGDDETSTAAQAEPVMEEQPQADPAPAVKAEPVKQTSKKAKKGAKSEAQIKAELDKMGQKLVGQSARTIMPNVSNKEVKQVGGQWVATYIAVDTNSVRTELSPGSSAGNYVGHIRYQEDVMECRGATKQAALSAPCQKARSRNLHELIRYDSAAGAWQD